MGWLVGADNKNRAPPPVPYSLPCQAGARAPPVGWVVVALDDVEHGLGGCPVREAFIIRGGGEWWKRVVWNAEEG